MMRHLCCTVLSAGTLLSSAQYPFTRSLGLLDGQRSVPAHCMAQDNQGLIWVGSEHGLFRTDGERTDGILRTDGGSVTSICSDAEHIYAALEGGAMVRCNGGGCDTLWTDTVFRGASVRSLLVDGRGGIWAGSYGAGVHIRRNGTTIVVDAVRGLTDDHVNALCAVGSDRVAVATDQGIALLDLDGKVMARFGEEQGAPDNLVLALCETAEGLLWAGGDRGGPFSFDPWHVDRGAHRLDPAWRHGPVTSIATTSSKVWAGTADHGVVIADHLLGLAYYMAQRPEQGAGHGVSDILLDRDHAVWWCDGSDYLRRADPDVLITTDHEQVDMQHITALALGRDDRIAFATRQGVFTHANTFVNEQHLERYVLPIDSTTQVVSLHTDTRGWLWAGTFGAGVFRIAPDGRIQRISGPDASINENVLAIRARGDEVWFATLGGVFRWTYSNEAGEGAIRAVPIPGSGFTFDVLPMPDGATLVATDGNGIVRIGADGNTRVLLDRSGAHRTFYSLCVDSAGQAWACGPSTGLCRVDADAVVPFGTGKGVMEDVFALVPHGSDIVMMGRPGLIVQDTRSGIWLDLTAEYGLGGAQAELNTACVDRRGSVWIATDKGLLRMGLTTHTAAAKTTAVITRVEQGGEEMPLGAPAELAADRNFLTIRASGLHYAAPEELGFVYRLITEDTIVRETRDREVALTGLAPGHYRFEVAARGEEGAAPDVWASFDFVVLRPWWRTPWAMASALLLVTILGVLALRIREARIRAQERTEQEKVRFQMQVLRSQVNPHFLFNSFNTLIALIEDAPDKAVKHVEQLSDFFREILQIRDKDLIPLSEELRLVDTYFFLEQRRFGDRIALRTSVTQSALDALVPPLTVQLLVENALKHNRASDEEPLVVHITSDKDTLTVSNPFRPRDTAPKSTGFGIDSIRQRFTALSQVPISAGRDDDRFVVRIPLIRPDT